MLDGDNGNKDENKIDAGNNYSLSTALLLTNTEYYKEDQLPPLPPPPGTPPGSPLVSAPLETTIIQMGESTLNFQETENETNNSNYNSNNDNDNNDDIHDINNIAHQNNEIVGSSLILNSEINYEQNSADSQHRDIQRRFYVI